MMPVMEVLYYLQTCAVLNIFFHTSALFLTAALQARTWAEKPSSSNSKLSSSFLRMGQVFKVYASNGVSMCGVSSLKVPGKRIVKCSSIAKSWHAQATLTIRRHVLLQALASVSSRACQSLNFEPQATKVTSKKRNVELC